MSNFKQKNRSNNNEIQYKRFIFIYRVKCLVLHMADVGVVLENARVLLVEANESIQILLRFRTRIPVVDEDSPVF